LSLIYQNCIEAKILQLRLVFRTAKHSVE
jgi:hypothetical protein